jgi:hypothetical protein
MQNGDGRKCRPGCACGKHSRVPVIDWDNPGQRRLYNRLKAAEKYAADPAPARGAARRWRERHPGYRAKREKVLGGMSAADLKWMYGVTAERVALMVAAQAGACYLCGEPLDFAVPRKVHVDHDHACCRGRQSCGTCVRGLACHSCNTAIGLFGEDPDRMRRVADNLEMANRRLRGPAPQGLNGAAVTPRSGKKE